MSTWIFTFGHGQRLRSTNAQGRADFAWNGKPVGEGFALHNRYVRIEGEHDDARAQMFAVFGQVWSMEYEEGPDTDEMIERFGLVELDIREPVGAPSQWRPTVDPKCTHGADCPVHPHVKRLHNIGESTNEVWVS